jgi:DNA-binding NarL/FixJ family response regulator
MLLQIPPAPSSASIPDRTSNCLRAVRAPAGPFGAMRFRAVRWCRSRRLPHIEFLTKPFRDQDLIDAIQLGLSRDRMRRENEKVLADLRERFASLSPREREIVIQVARGRLSKQIAHDIGIAEATVKVHRSRAMQKMNARSLPELGRMADKLKLVIEEPQRS